MNTQSEIYKSRNALRAQAFVTIGLLIIQFILGMLTNLFVHFPDTTQVESLWEYARSQLPAMAHIIAALLLLASGVVFMVRAARQPDCIWLVSAIAGLTGIVVAFFGGVMFISFQQEGYSLTMALGFMIAFVAYGWGCYATNR
jgi:hypothetical protein